MIVIAHWDGIVNEVTARGVRARASAMYITMAVCKQTEHNLTQTEHVHLVFSTATVLFTEGNSTLREKSVSCWRQGNSFKRQGVREKTFTQSNERRLNRFKGSANLHLQLLLVLDEVYVLVIATLVARRHRVRMSDRGRTRVLEVAGGARWHRQQQLRSCLLHALVHAVDTVHGGTAGTKIRQVEERTEAHDTERHEYQKDQVLLARTEGPSREQRHRYAVREALVRRQHASRRAHLTATHRHTCNTPRHLITTPVLTDTRKLEHPCAFRTRGSSAVVRHYESSTTCV